MKGSKVKVTTLVVVGSVTRLGVVGGVRVDTVDKLFVRVF